MKLLLKKWWLLTNLLLLLFTKNVKGQTFQNIIPNGSFESYTQCPNNGNQVYYAPPWTGPTTNSSDYWNACSSLYNVPYYGGLGSAYPYYLNAKEGVAYAGIHFYNDQNYREYLQVELLDTLRKNQCYYMEFYATNCQNTKYYPNNVAATFSILNYTTNLNPSNSLINLPLHINNYANPILLDTVKWTKVSGIFESTGSEKYLIIGNFKNDLNTDTISIYSTSPFKHSNLPTVSYIFIDAVSMYSLDPHGNLPWSYRDTTINEGDSVFIGNQMGGLNFHPKWYKEDGTFITTNAGITVKPETTSKYVVQFTLCDVPRTDTVKVTVIPRNVVGINKLAGLGKRVKVYPVPAKDYLELEISNTDLQKDCNKISIYNNLGVLLREEHLYFENSKFILKTEDLPDGVYSLQLKSVSMGTVSKRFVIAR